MAAGKFEMSYSDVKFKPIIIDADLFADDRVKLNAFLIAIKPILENLPLVIAIVAFSRFDNTAMVDSINAANTAANGLINCTGRGISFYHFKTLTEFTISDVVCDLYKKFDARVMLGSKMYLHPNISGSNHVSAQSTVQDLIKQISNPKKRIIFLDIKSFKVMSQIKSFIAAVNQFVKEQNLIIFFVAVGGVAAASKGTLDVLLGEAPAENNKKLIRVLEITHPKREWKDDKAKEEKLRRLEMAEQFLAAVRGLNEEFVGGVMMGKGETWSLSISGSKQHVATYFMRHIRERGEKADTVETVLQTPQPESDSYKKIHAQLDVNKAKVLKEKRRRSVTADSKKLASMISCQHNSVSETDSTSTEESPASSPIGCSNDEGAPSSSGPS